MLRKNWLYRGNTGVKKIKSDKTLFFSHPSDSKTLSKTSDLSL